MLKITCFVLHMCNHNSDVNAFTVVLLSLKSNNSKINYKKGMSPMMANKFKIEEQQQKLIKSSIVILQLSNQHMVNFNIQTKR